MDGQLAVNIGQVTFDGTDAEVETLSHCFVAQTLGQQDQYLSFAFGQGFGQRSYVDACLASHTGYQLQRQRLGKACLADSDLADGVEQVVQRNIAFDAAQHALCQPVQQDNFGKLVRNNQQASLGESDQNRGQNLIRKVAHQQKNGGRLDNSG